MIINTPDGAVLEIFWRERGAKPWSQATAHRFLARFRTDRLGLQGARWMLTDRTDAGRTWRTQDSAILQRTAWLIATNSVIVAEFGGVERWPGSGFVLGSGPDSALLFWRDQLHLPRDTAQVLEWISDMQSLIEKVANLSRNREKPNSEDAQALEEDKQHIQDLRKLIASEPGVAQPDRLNDDDFLHLVANYFRSGELLPIYHRYPGIAEPGPDGDLPAAPASKRSNGGDDSEDPSDDPLLPGACLVRASNTGTPFVTIPEPGEDA